MDGRRTIPDVLSACAIRQTSDGQHAGAAESRRLICSASPVTRATTLTIGSPYRVLTRSAYERQRGPRRVHACRAIGRGGRSSQSVIVMLGTRIRERRERRHGTRINVVVSLHGRHGALAIRLLLDCDGSSRRAG
jgi:hypothetical protein